jgi:hypothetical protein
MSKALEIAKQILALESQQDALASERPKILASLFQAEADGDSKSAQKVRGGLSEHDQRIDAHRQHKIDLEVALDRAIGDEMDRQAASVPEMEAALKKELRDAGREIGELLAKAEFLESCYGGHGYSVWANSLDPYGRRPSAPESCSALYAAINEAKSATIGELRGTDPNAESFFERKNALRDAKEQNVDANVKRHRVAKQRAIIMSFARTGE